MRESVVVRSQMRTNDAEVPASCVFGISTAACILGDFSFPFDFDAFNDEFC